MTFNALFFATNIQYFIFMGEMIFSYTSWECPCAVQVLWSQHNDGTAVSLSLPVPTRLVMCDMLEGSVERIVRSNSLLRWMDKLHLLSFVVRHRQQSYAVVTQVY